LSKIALSGNLSGTGTFTLASPNSNSDRTLTLPDSAGTIQVSGNPISGTTGTFSGDLSFNSGYGSAAVAYGCRAWVNFNGTGTVAINASGNVSSVTDNGAGDYTVNFTTAMPDANFAVGGNCLEDTADFRGDRVLTMYRRTPVASSCRVNTVNFAGTPVDNARVYVVIFR
jgi:hypothetical protein